MMPAISNMTLLRIMADNPRMTPITSNAPASAPNTAAKNPEKEKAPAPTVPPPANITNATPRLAPELMPRMEGSAKGLLNAVCNIKPDEANAAPQSNAVMHSGKRLSRTMKVQASFPAGCPKRMRHTSAAGMSTDPASKLAATSKMVRTDNTPAHKKTLWNSGIFVFIPLIYENISYPGCRKAPDGTF